MENMAKKKMKIPYSRNKMIDESVIHSSEKVASYHFYQYVQFIWHYRLKYLYPSFTSHFFFILPHIFCCTISCCYTIFSAHFFSVRYFFVARFFAIHFFLPVKAFDSSINRTILYKSMCMWCHLQINNPSGARNRMKNIITNKLHSIFNRGAKYNST